MSRLRDRVVQAAGTRGELTLLKLDQLTEVVSAKCAGRFTARWVAVHGDDWTVLHCKSCFQAMPASAHRRNRMGGNDAGSSRGRRDDEPGHQHPETAADHADYSGWLVGFLDVDPATGTADGIRVEDPAGGPSRPASWEPEQPLEPERACAAAQGSRAGRATCPAGHGGLRVPDDCESRRARPVKESPGSHLGRSTGGLLGGDRETSKEPAVTDPVLIAMTVACAHGAMHLLDALAERIILRARRDLIHTTASLPPGTEIEQDRTGKGWRVEAAPHGRRGRRGRR